MDPAVVMVHPPKRPPLQGGGGPPGIPAATFSNPAFQAQMAGLTPSQQAQVIANAQQQALLANGGRPAGQQSLGAGSVGQPGLGTNQARQPGGPTGLGQQFPNQLSGPYGGHMQTKAPAQPAPFTQQSATGPAGLASENRDARGVQDSRSAQDSRQQQDPRQHPGDMQHNKPFASQTASKVADGGDGRSPPQNSNRTAVESSPPQKAPGYAVAAGGVSKPPDSEIGTWKPEGASESNTWTDEGGEDSEGRVW